jgi:hypothetical protein
MELKMRQAGLALAIALIAAWATSALAHHSGVAYDFTKRVQIAGTVKAIRVINPHMSVTLEYKDGDQVKTIEFEGHSANNMYRGGWRPDKVKVGDRVTLVIAPRRDGKDGGYVNSIITKTGEEVGFKMPAPTTPANAPPPPNALPPGDTPGTAPSNQ